MTASMTCVDDKHSKILAEKNVRRECAHARSCNFYTFLAKLEAGWRQAGGRLEGVHVRIYTFLAKLEAGWRQ